jgi:hypothetical protein
MGVIHAMRRSVIYVFEFSPLGGWSVGSSKQSHRYVPLLFAR